MDPSQNVSQIGGLATPFVAKFPFDTSSTFEVALAMLHTRAVLNVFIVSFGYGITPPCD